MMKKNSHKKMKFSAPVHKFSHAGFMRPDSTAVAAPVHTFSYAGFMRPDSPEVAAPEVAGVMRIEASAPEVAAPEVAAPEVSGIMRIEASAPEVAAPEVAGLMRIEASAPEVAAPEVAAPEVAGFMRIEAAAPEVADPEVGAACVGHPEIAVSDNESQQVVDIICDLEKKGLLSSNEVATLFNLADTWFKGQSLWVKFVLGSKSADEQKARVLKSCLQL